MVALRQMSTTIADNSTITWTAIQEIKNNGNTKQLVKGEHEPTDPSAGRGWGWHHLKPDRRDHALQRQFVQQWSATTACEDNSSNS